MPATATILSMASLAVSGVLGITAYLFSRRLEHLKADLSAQIESQKVDWALAAKLSEIRFSRLHEKQFDALQRAFTLLTYVHHEFIDILKRYRMSNERTDAEKLNAAGKAARDLQEFLNTDGVLLPPALGVKIEEVNNAFLTAWLDIGMKDVDQQIFFKGSESYFEKVPPLLLAIREEIQQQLGVKPK